jgi:hypothetical protein
MTVLLQENRFVQQKGPILTSWLSQWRQNLFQWMLSHGAEMVTYCRGTHHWSLSSKASSNVTMRIMRIHVDDSQLDFVLGTYFYLCLFFTYSKQRALHTRLFTQLSWRKLTDGLSQSRMYRETRVASREFKMLPIKNQLSK